jgi:hypothetical protein
MGSVRLVILWFELFLIQTATVTHIQGKQHEAAGLLVGPEPAVARWHAQVEEPLGAEIGIVVEAKGCGAVVGRSARGAKRSQARRRAVLLK